METNNLLKEINNKVSYLECLDFYKDISKVTDINYFSKIMEQKKEEKSKIEEGLIYLSSKKQLEDFEITFLNKYHTYLKSVLEKDVREYFNNKYCIYLYSSLWKKLPQTKNEDEINFFNGKSLVQIYNAVIGKYNYLIKKINTEEKLEDNDRLFLEEEFLFEAYNRAIYKEYKGQKYLMYDIVDYFSKYPIKDLSSPRNKQLYILEMLSKKMIEIKGNSAIMFSSNNSDVKSGYVSLGSFFKIHNGQIPCIELNNLEYGLNTEKDLLNKIFDLFHEIGHFKQEVEFDDFTDEAKKLILMEKDIINKNYSFYITYHDSFLLEKDADNYATIEFMKEFGSKYPSIVYEIVSKRQKKIELMNLPFILWNLKNMRRIYQMTKIKKLIYSLNSFSIYK